MPRTGSQSETRSLGRIGSLLLATVSALVLLWVPDARAAEPRWFWQNPIPQGNDLLDMAFEPEGLRGWAAGRNGAFIRTETAGALWVEHATPPSPSMTWVSVATPSDGVIWTVDGAGTVWRSTDAGVTWEQVEIQAGGPGGGTVLRHASFIRFRSATLGWLGTVDGHVLVTRDGGQSWQSSLTTQVGEAVREIIDVDGTVFAAIAGELDKGGGVWRSTDGGESWQKCGSVYAGADVDFYDSQIGVVVAGSHVQLTRDGGRTWTRRSVPVMQRSEEADATAVWMASASRVFVFTDHEHLCSSTDGGSSWTRDQGFSFVDRYGGKIGGPPVIEQVARRGWRTFLFGQAGAILYSTDKGRTFQALTADFSDTLRGVSFSDELHGVAVGTGALLVTSDGGATWVRQSIDKELVLESVCMVGDVGWAVGRRPFPPAILRLERDGDRLIVTEQELPGVRKGWLYDVWTNDGVTAWAVGTHSDPDLLWPYACKTTDAGATWQSIPMPDTEFMKLHDVRVFPDGTGWLLSDIHWSNGKVRRTTNGGEGWPVVESVYSGKDLDALDGDVCFVRSAAGSTGMGARVTHDGGRSWTQIGTSFQAGEVSHFYYGDIAFADRDLGYMSGAGRLFSTTDGGADWSEHPTATAGIYDIEVHGESAWAVGVGGTVLYNGGAEGDFTPPITRSSLPTGWLRTSATVYLAPDDQCGVEELWWAYGDEREAAATVGRRDSEFKLYTGPIRVTAQGVTPITAFSVDVNGNRETARLFQVRIDRNRPVPKARCNRAVRRYRTVKLLYRVNDAYSPKAKKVIIKIFKGRRCVHTITLRNKPTNANLTCRYRCRLKKGTYTWKVYATDLAGNKQAKPSVRKLNVR